MIRVPESDTYPDGKKNVEQFDLDNPPAVEVKLTFTCEDGSTVTRNVSTAGAQRSGTYLKVKIKIPENAKSYTYEYVQADFDEEHVLGTPDSEKAVTQNSAGTFNTLYVPIKVNPTPEPIRMIVHKVTRDNSAKKNGGISDTAKGVTYWYLTPEDKEGTIISEEFIKGTPYDISDRIKQTVVVNGVLYKYNPNDAYSATSPLSGEAGIKQGDIKSQIYVTYDRVEYTVTFNYKDVNGNVIQEPTTKNYDPGSSYDFAPPEIDVILRIIVIPKNEDFV